MTDTDTRQAALRRRLAAMDIALDTSRSADELRKAITDFLALADSAEEGAAPDVGAELAEALIRMRDGDVPGSTMEERSGLQYAAFWLAATFPAIRAAASTDRSREPRLDVATLVRAMERAMAAVDDEWTIPEFAELTAAEYARLENPEAT
jgi:hypothetical protein